MCIQLNKRNQESEYGRLSGEEGCLASRLQWKQEKEKKMKVK